MIQRKLTRLSRALRSGLQARRSWPKWGQLDGLNFSAVVVGFKPGLKHLFQAFQPSFLTPSFEVKIQHFGLMLLERCFVTIRFVASHDVSAELK